MRKLFALCLFGVALGVGIERVCSSASANNTCAICNANSEYINDGAGGCLAHFAQYCTLPDENGQCLRCASGVPMGAICYQGTAVSQCAKYNADKTCAYCKTPYYLDGQTCKVVTQLDLTGKCAVYGTATTCAGCVGGYVLENGVCQLAISNCLVQAGITCRACAANSYSTAPPTPRVALDSTFWRVYASQNTAAFSLPDVSQITYTTSTSCPTNTDPNCTTSSSLTQCAVCAANYYPGSNGLCTAVSVAGTVANCSLYSAQSVCTQCASGNYLTATGGVTSCTTNPVNQTANNCLYYSAVSTCSRCASGYYLSGLACLPSSALTGCDVFAASSTCTYCSSNYYVSAGVCLAMSAQTVSGCAAYDQTGCKFCDSTHAPSVATPLTCTPLTAGQTVASCSRYSSTPACTECAVNFFMSSSKCYAVADSNCNYFLSSGLCGECKTTHYLNTTTGVCTIVPPSYGTVSSSCLRMSDASGSVQCTLCGGVNPVLGTSMLTCAVVPGGSAISGCASYSLTGSVYTCVRCSSGNYLLTTNGTCPAVNTPTGSCAVYPDGTSSPTTCTYCSNPQVINGAGTTCGLFQTVTGCAVYSAYGTCSVCSSTTYALNASTCWSVQFASLVAGCTRYDTTPACTECGLVSGQQQYLISGKCVALTIPLPNCKYHATLYICAICNPLYYADANGMCVSTTLVQNCAEYTTGGACLNCATNFYLNGGACTALTGISNCATYASATTCAVCSGSNYLSNGACLAITASPIQGCLAYDSATTCSSCFVGYSLATNKLTCIASCDTANSTGCVLCSGNFYSNQGTCTTVTSQVQNCRYYSSASQCIICSSGYVLRSNVCVAVQGSTNCDYLVDTNGCIACMPGYVLGSNGCTAISANITGCLIPASDMQSCSVCDASHYQTTLAGPCISNDSYLGTM